MRGFLPAALTLLLALFAAGSWILWQGPGAATPGSEPVRAVLGRGVVLVNWGSPNQRDWIGGRGWSLGTMIDAKGNPKPGWFVSRPVWSAWRLKDAELSLQLHPGHVKVSLLWVALVLAAPPAGAMVRRRWRRERSPSQCRACGYDLRGTAGGVCPECGAARPADEGRG